MIDHERLKLAVKKLYEVVSELSSIAPGRHFTPDGHMVGSLGEVLVADLYGLDLEPASNPGFDARTKDGLQVEIKCTQGKSVAFRSSPEHTIAIKLNQDGSFDELYNGPGHLIWEQFQGKPLPKNGQYSISVTKLRALNLEVPPHERIVKKT